MFVAIAVRENDQRPKPKNPVKVISAGGMVYSNEYFEGILPSGNIPPEFGESREEAARKMFKKLERNRCDNDDYDVLVGELTHKASPPEPPIVLVPLEKKPKSE